MTTACRPYLAVLLEVFADGHSFLDHVIKILRYTGCQPYIHIDTPHERCRCGQQAYTFGLQYSQDLVPSDQLHLSHAMRIPQNHP